MKKSFKKLGFVSLATSSVLLGSMNATDLQTYAALQKPSHVFGNYAETKKDKDSKDTNSDKDKGNSGSTPTPSTPPTKEEPKKTASSTPTPSGSSVASQLVKDATTVNSFKSVSVSGMNTTLSGVETMFK